MTRVAFWFAVYLLSLGMLDIDAKYADGLHIQITGWPTAIKKRRGADGT